MMNIWKLLANVGMAIITVVATVVFYVCNADVEYHSKARHLYGYND